MLITVPQVERYKRPTFEDLLNGLEDFEQLKMSDDSGCITREVKHVQVTPAIRQVLNRFASQIHAFVIATEQLRTDDRHAHYKTFKIPKRSGGLRTINAPDDELMMALRNLMTIINGVMPRTYHTNAYAYVANRCTYDAVAKHQKWQSNWFGHFDFQDFFGSTTKEFLLAQMEIQFPFVLIKTMYPNAWTDLVTALDLCFLDGGLPQGTPASPMLTNIMMIPFDYTVTTALHQFQNKKSKQGTDRFIYTRYADDIHISCRVEFDIRAMEQYLVDTLEAMRAPFTIKKEKTHYGSRSGQNWMLGYCLNKDNAISIGHENKKVIKAMIHTWASDRKKPEPVRWDIDDLQVLLGKINYWRFSEKELVDHTLVKLSEKYGFNVIDSIKEDMGYAS